MLRTSARNVHICVSMIDLPSHVCHKEKQIFHGNANTGAENKPRFDFQKN